MVGLSFDRGVFMFVFKPMDPECDPKMLKPPFPLTLVTEVRIRFCPWCGVNLVKKYSKQDALPRLSTDPCGLTF